MKRKHNGKLVHRTLLFSAGHNLKYIHKSFTTECDAIVFDLEDAVPEDKKEEARNILKKIFESGSLPDDRSVYVRINPLDSGYTLLDLDATISANINGFVYPMAKRAEDIIAFDAQLSLKEKLLDLPQGYFDIIVLIETPAAVLKVYEIASASKRVKGLLFGSEDFLAGQEGRHGKDGRGIEVPRHLVAMTAKSLGIMAIDTPYVNVGDFEGLEKHINQARDLGFDGMLIMSPREIEMANSLYTPDKNEVHHANEIVRLSAEASKDNKGIIMYNGVFVSPPTLKAARKLLEKYDAIKKYEKFINDSKR